MVVLVQAEALHGLDLALTVQAHVESGDPCVGRDGLVVGEVRELALPVLDQVDVEALDVAAVGDDEDVRAGLGEVKRLLDQGQQFIDELFGPFLHLKIMNMIIMLVKKYFHFICLFL